MLLPAKLTTHTHTRTHTHAHAHTHTHPFTHTPTHPHTHTHTQPQTGALQRGLQREYAEETQNMVEIKSPKKLGQQ